MNTEELGTLIKDLKQDDFDITWLSRDKFIAVLDEIKDTEDDSEIEVIKKVVVHMNKVATGYIDENGKEFAPNDFYKLPEHLENLNIYLPEEVNDDSAGDLTDTGTPKKVVEKKGEKKEKPLREEQKKQLKIEEMLKGNDDYKKIADEIKKAEKNLNTEITRRKTHIAKLKIKAKDKANMIFGDLYAKGNLK